MKEKKSQKLFDKILSDISGEQENIDNEQKDYNFDYLGKDPNIEKGPNEESQKYCHI